MGSFAEAYLLVSLEKGGLLSDNNSVRIKSTVTIKVLAHRIAGS